MRALNRVGLDEFAAHVLEGLSHNPKFLSSRYFYDERGDKLFQAIMASPEYYPTKCEFEILREQGDEIARALLTRKPREFVELGSGDGQKIALLLDALHRHGPGWVYRPVDISDHSLELLESHLLPDRPWLQLDSIHGNYHEVLESFDPQACRRVFVFLGSNLGNFGEAGSIEFLREVRGAMSDGDSLLIGLDLKKDPEVIKAAYDDSAGHTRAFNLNLLSRINRELGGDFDIERFEHQPEYDPLSGAARSYIASRIAQKVNVAALGQTFEFAEGERIHVEISQKYDDEMIGEICREAGFRQDQGFYDRKGWFTDQIWCVNS